MSVAPFQPDTGAFEFLSPLDIGFARFIASRGGDMPEVQLAATLLSSICSRGHVSLDLENCSRSLPALPELDNLRFPDPGVWAESLLDSPVVGRPGEFAPLVLDGSRLYLHRYWTFEHEVATALLERARVATESDLPPGLQKRLHTLFPDDEGDGENWQRAAALTIATRRFSVVTGGPGTGKTTTVAGALALLLEMHPGHNPRILLAAPTGKAAARIEEAMHRAADRLPCSQSVRERLPRNASTVHRLLGAIPDSNLFRHGPDNPLAADLVVVDEASMMALPLVWALIRALPSECRLVLVGDRHQLASVEPGAVLGDLCDQRALQQFSPPAAGDLNRQASLDVPVPARTERLHPLCDSIVELRKVHRFSGDLARLNDAVRSGETATAISILRTAGQVEWIEEPVQEQLPARVHALLENELSGYLNSDTPQQALEAWSSFRILCAVRNGPAGVIAMNRALESLLLRRKRPRTSGDWFERQPVIVMRNNYRRRLYNGDIGVVMRDTEAPGAPLRAFFPATDGTLRPVSPHRLPEHESAFALTVHKSQGSEFDHVLLILPDQDSPVLSRELLYTAITRARKRLTIWATPSIMETALRRETIRETGLRDRLWRKQP